MGGATVGKTTLKSLMDRKGIAVTDTDDIIESVIPGFFKTKVNLAAGPVADLVSECRDIIVADTITRQQPKYVLTGLWSSTFLQRLFAAAPGVKPGGIAVFRANALEITTLSRKRGSALSTRLTSKWATSAEKYAHSSFDYVVWLPVGVFLDDVVGLSAEGWFLKPLGIELAKEDRRFALSYVFKQREEGSDENS